MTTYLFLSDDWLESARAIRAEFEGQEFPGTPPMRMNLNVQAVPFGEGEMLAHVDTSGGSIILEVGHLTDPELTVTVDYEIARAILVEGNPQAGLQAFMSGKIKVEGDMSKLMAFQGMVPSPASVDLAARILAITE